MSESAPGSVSPSEPRKNDSFGSPPKPARPESRRHLRFRIDEADANPSLKGFVISLGLGRANMARAAINLSEGGVMLLMRELIPLGAQVIVRIEMEKSADVIETTGEVRWCEPSARSDREYHAGIQFTGMAEADLRKIAQMRERFSSGEPKSGSAPHSGPPEIRSAV